MITIVNADQDLSLQLQTLKERFGPNKILGEESILDARVILYTRPQDIIERARQYPKAYHVLIRDNAAKKSAITQEDLKRNGMDSMVSINDMFSLMNEVEKGLKGVKIVEEKKIEVVPPSSIQKNETSIVQALGYPETFEEVRNVLAELNPAASVKEAIQKLGRKYDNSPTGVRTHFVKHAFEYLRNNPEVLKNGYDGHPAPALQDRSYINIIKRQQEMKFDDAQAKVNTDQGPGLEQGPQHGEEQYFQEIIDKQYQELEDIRKQDALIKNSTEPMPENKSGKQAIPYAFDPDVDLRDHIEKITDDGKVQIKGLVNNHIIGTSPAVVNMLFQLSRVVKFPQQDILVLGENGAGKDLVMKVIGENCFKTGTGLDKVEKRISQPLEVINIGAESDELFRSALMGHEKGAFTDAKEKRLGYLRSNPNANLAIDEIGDVSQANQSTLLRVIQNREGIAVGADKPYNFDKRLIFATNKDLSALRVDLRQRLSQGIIMVPPLRDRKEDIPLLVGFILNQANKDYPSEKKSSSTKAIDLLKNPKMEWPGNVRELQTTVMRAFMMELSNTISEKSVQASIKASRYEPQTANLKQNYQVLESIKPAEFEYEVVGESSGHALASQKIN